MRVDDGARNRYPGLKPVSMKSFINALRTLRCCEAGTPYISQRMLHMHNTWVMRQC